MKRQNSAPSPAQSLDRYEAKYMAESGEDRLRVKTRMDRRGVTVFAAIAAVIMVQSISHSAPLLVLTLGIGMLLLGLAFSVLRVRLTDSHLQVQYGMIGPSIPLDAIESVDAVTHDHRSWLRWGVSPLARGTWLYSIAGDQGRAVKVVWRNAKGERRIHYIGSPEHRTLADAIEVARTERPAPDGRRALPADSAESDETDGS